MINKIFIKPINYCHTINDNLLQIKIEDSMIYRTIYYEFQDNIILSCSDEPVKEKDYIIISNPFEITLNDKKSLTNLYKSLEKKISEETEKEIINAKNTIMNLIESLLFNSDADLEYDDESFDISKLLSMYQVKYKEINYMNYIEKVIEYIKININILNIKYVISFGLLDLIDDIDLFKKELKLLNIILIDFKYEKRQNNIDYIFIDKDYCVL